MSDEQVTELQNDLAALKAKCDSQEDVLAQLLHDRQVARGENSRELDPTFYEFLPVAARRAHTGKPLATSMLNRLLSDCFVNPQREYQPPGLHPAYHTLGATVVSRDKEICQLALQMAHALRPLDEILSLLPGILERDEEQGSALKAQVEILYQVLFNGMASATEQRVHQLVKLLKSAPGEYDEQLLVDPKPVIEAREAFTALTAKIKPEPEDKGAVQKRNTRPKAKRPANKMQDARTAAPEPTRPRQADGDPEPRADRDQRRDNTSQRRNDNERPNGRSRSRARQ
ncbi:hypothetical protein GGI21_002464 [Coemansia aciculifera]|nr:hypothetical protein GGI21_002464 [Coemansia aciculifera]